MINSEQHGRDDHATPINHGRDDHATSIDHGRDDHATSIDHGRDDHATPINHGRDDHATPINHGRDDHATQDQSDLKIRQGTHLPHWTMEGSIYTVTFRLNDSLPQNVLEKWLFEREDIINTASQLGRPISLVEMKRLYYIHSEKIDKYLDLGHGECTLKDDHIAEIVSKSLVHFNKDRYNLFAWCVMPNHVHVIVKPLKGYELPKILHSWKSYTSHEINKLLGRTGKFWQEEYYDHLIRDEKDFWRCMEYVLSNPEKAGLKDWKWRSNSIDTAPEGE